MVQGESYSTYTMSSGETRQWNVGSGGTLSNLLIDMRASGCEPNIDAQGSNWVIENVGFWGTNDVHKDPGNWWAMVHPSGDGTIRNCYFGDGCRGVDEANKSAIGVPAAHSGHIDMENCFFGYWADNAVYSAHTVNGGGGTVRFNNCHFRNNQVTGCRVAMNGDLIEHCTFDSFEPPPVPLNTGGQHVKGVYTGYGNDSHRVLVDNCDVDIRNENNRYDTDAFNSGPNSWRSSTDSEIYVRNTQYLGTIEGNVTIAGGNGSSPDVTPRSGIPYGPELAAANSTQSVIRLVNNGSGAVDYWIDVDGTPSEVGIRGGGNDNTVDFSGGVARLWGTVGAGDNDDLYIPRGASLIRYNANPGFGSVHVSRDEYEISTGSLGSLNPSDPVASFYMNGGTDISVDAGEPVSFDASTSWPPGSITSYQWDFGDGTTGTGQTTSHTYTNDGSYDVTLTVSA